ncbi:aldehyde dehydrogenase family protein [Iocasia frigidifontis]|uniref:Aldehyde dehydrogenase family protein n=1 Tax=Iocasia fonsfrigidae TaxID=2682810 RepID=A0A8A7KF47_9FIRM|nr:aldehyde dehydrogenase family protein [Iocasia fonsfrigidae]
MNTEELNEIVKEVLQEFNEQDYSSSQKESDKELGIYDSMEEAITAARRAQKEYQANFSLQERETLIAAMRKEMGQHLEELAQKACEESEMGRVADKIIKNRMAVEKTPGTEDLKTEAYSGRDGLTVIEQAPFGVICSIAPVTNPTETIICNAIGMLAAGNAVVFNPHPRAKNVSKLTIKLLNKAIVAAGGPSYLLTAVKEPTIQTVESCMKDERIIMVVATGGPGVVKAALSSGKKAIGAGAGNPPVIVDRTADLKKAAVDIIKGASFDNNLPCTSEKVIMAVKEIADDLLKYMTEDKAQLVKDPAALEKIVLNEDGSINKDMVGKDASYIMEQAGLKAKGNLRLIVVDVDFNHPFVQKEQLMPVIPLVRVEDFNTAVKLAVEVEHGNRHTAAIHSKNVDNLTCFAKKIETTIYVKNAPSYAGIGVGGEGHATFTIAGPTGEGLTSARTFTRRRRCVLVDGFSII